METSQLNRGQFLKQLGLSSAALMSFYCLGKGWLPIQKMILNLLQLLEIQVK